MRTASPLPLLGADEDLEELMAFFQPRRDSDSPDSSSSSTSASPSPPSPSALSDEVTDGLGRLRTSSPPVVAVQPAAADQALR
jgi:hypothetical protein